MPNQTINFLKNNWAIILLSLLCLVSMLVEIKNDRFWMSDLEVYYETAGRLLRGENLYRVEGKIFYVFKYSPVSALFFIPLFTLPYSVAKVIYWLFISVTFLWGIFLAMKLSSVTEPRKIPYFNVLFFFIAASTFIHIFRELHLGQVNHLIFLLYLMVLYYFMNGNTKISALFWSISVFFKPFGLIFLPYFIIKGEFKLILYFLLWGIGLFFIPLIFFPSYDMFVDQYWLWVKEMLFELYQKRNLLENGNHTIFSVIFRHSPLGMIITGQKAIQIYTLLVFALLGLMTFFFVRKKGNYENATAMDFGLMLCLIPLLSYTSRNAFIFTELAIAFVMVRFTSLKIQWEVLLIASMLFIGGNNIELLGRKLTLYLEGISIVSIGAMLMVFLLLALRFERKTG